MTRFGIRKTYNTQHTTKIIVYVKNISSLLVTNRIES